MVTARAAFGAKRARRPAGALRLLWLAALLFAFLYTHAAGADTASAHVVRGAVPAVPVAHLDAIGADDDAPHDAGARRGHDDGNGSGHGHPAEACASGHPQQGAELPEPPLVPLGEPSPAVAAMRPGSWAPTVPSGLPPLRSVLGSVVQQV
ncbi:hypothetical protein [Streptomyces sp. AP-93]|uniref:hypothetical protein n=1 Tax=Streptomyces sp. AP-93 TaxID=2929048 RepID=UPI001FAE83AD|nr:hypothetical protein [Streptomyces sp. AP-93]MCJ0874549.1 hypothetical protein [Streptomyces sp. AP-93]